MSLTHRQFMIVAPVLLALAMLLVGAVYAYNIYDTEMQKKFVNNNLVGHRDEEGFFSYVTQPYQIDEESATNIYFRWASSPAANVWIKRANKAGNIWTFTKTYTNWPMRTAAVWSAIN